MTRSELDKVAARVGGWVQLTDMLTQITRAMHCPLVRAYADRPKGPDTIYNFFAGTPLHPDAGYYLEIDEESTLDDKDTRVLASYDIIHLTYGYFAGEPAGEGYTFPFIRGADNRYHLIKMKEYPWLVH